jgi:ParB family chromosome partitioning protein
VTESLSLNQMPEEVKNLCRLADIGSKSLLLQIVRQSDPRKMMALVEKMTREGINTRQELRKAAAVVKPKAGRPRNYIFSYKAPTRDFNLKLQFKKSQVQRDEIIDALMAIIRELRSAD